MSDVERERLLRRGGGYTSSPSLALNGTGTEASPAEQRAWAGEAREREERRRVASERSLRNTLQGIERHLDAVIGEMKAAGVTSALRATKDARLDVRAARRQLDGG
jgi:hypothetical protein